MEHIWSRSVISMDMAGLPFSALKAKNDEDTSTKSNSIVSNENGKSKVFSEHSLAALLNTAC